MKVPDIWVNLPSARTTESRYLPKAFSMMRKLEVHSTLALGAEYPKTGSKNVSVIHWDMICDIREDSEIHVDGELLYIDGEFQI